MKLESLVNAPPSAPVAPSIPGAPNQAPAAPALSATPVGVFITAQSLTTFPVASTLVTIVWKVLGKVNASLSNEALVPLIVALFIGLAIYGLSADKGNTGKERLVSFFIAILNSFMLTAAALGIDTTIDPNTPAAF